MPSLPGDYRERIYQFYQHTFAESALSQSVEGFAPRMPYLERLIARHFPANRAAQVLDLGCGQGALLYAAQQAGYLNVSGVDRSPVQVDTARRLGIRGVQQGDLMQALRERASASLDCVIAFDVLEHFHRRELIGVVDELHRVLRVGGRLLIHVPNGESPFGGGIRWGDLTHELAFTRVSLRQLMLSSGFAHVECYEDTPVPHGWKSRVRAALWPVLRYGLIGFVAIETGALERSAIFTQNLLAVVER